MHNRRPSPGLMQHGFTYTEVMLSAVLLALLVVPALQALQTGVTGGAAVTIAAQRPTLSAKMEEVLSKPFSDLYALTYLAGGNTAGSVKDTLSDANGATDRRVVVLYRYNASAKTLSNTDTGLLYVSVYYEAEGSTNALNTLAGLWW